MMPRRIALLRLLPAFFAVAGFSSCGGGGSEGLNTELLTVPGYPLASVRILVTVGSAMDPPGREGLCRLAWSMLAGGGSRATARGEIAARLFPLGAEIGLSVDKEISVFSGTVRAADLEAFYSVLRECLLEPGFREEDFRRIQSAQLAELERDLPGSVDDDRLADEILNLMMYDGHPYGHPDLGLASSVKEMSLNDVKEFYRKHFVQGNIILGLGGEFGQALMSRAMDDFKTLPRGSTPLPALPDVRPPAGLEVGIVEKAVSADTVRLGFPIPVRRGDKDFFPLWIAAASLGETGMPFDRLVREDGTIAPGSRIADAAIEHPAWRSSRFPRPNRVRWQQHFSVRLAVPESGGGARAASGLLEAMRTLAAEGISEERFEMTRARLLAEVPLYKRTLEEHLAWRMDSKLTGYLDFLDEVQYALRRVSREDASLAARAHLDPRSARFAVVTGDAEAFAAGLAADSVRAAPASDFFKAPGWPGR